MIKSVLNIIPFSIEKQVSQFDHQSPCEIICKDLKKKVQLGTVSMKKSGPDNMVRLICSNDKF